MPQASDELRAKMGELFGHGLDKSFIDDWPPTEYLLNRNWKCDKGWWTPPADESKIADSEWDCMQFLIEEWDHALRIVEETKQ